MLRPGPDIRALALDFALGTEADASRNGSQVAIVVNGVEAARWGTPRPGPPMAGRVCLPVRAAEQPPEVFSIILEQHGPVVASAPASLVLQSILPRDAKPGECRRGSHP